MNLINAFLPRCDSKFAPRRHTNKLGFIAQFVNGFRFKQINVCETLKPVPCKDYLSLSLGYFIQTIAVSVCTFTVVIALLIIKLQPKVCRLYIMSGFSTIY